MLESNGPEGQERFIRRCNYSGVTMVLQCCHSGGTVVLQWSERVTDLRGRSALSGGAMTSAVMRAMEPPTVVVWWCHIGATIGLQLCLSGVTVVSQRCYINVTVM
jgi:hypothetical protein